MSVVRDERAVYFPKYLPLGGDEGHSSVLDAFNTSLWAQDH